MFHDAHGLWLRRTEVDRRRRWGGSERCRRIGRVVAASAPNEQQAEERDEVEGGTLEKVQIRVPVSNEGAEVISPRL